MSAPRLLADIGGTNVRFALSDPDGGISSHRSHSVRDFPEFTSALETYLSEVESEKTCGSAAVCAAGPVRGGEVQLTNAPWKISEAETSRLLGDVPVRLINDLEAVAMALPYLDEADVSAIGKIGEFPSGSSTMLALNVGTGFGAAAVRRVGDSWIACPSEAGHMSLGAQSESELELLGGTDQASFAVESVLSGGGFVNLYQKLCERMSCETGASTAKEILAQVSFDRAAEESLRLFTIWLGRVAKDLVLATASWGGVFLSGGVIAGWADVASAPLFRESFESGGKMEKRLRDTYSGVIVRKDAALMGLARVPL